jgi:arginine utilization protein RocB
MQQHTNELKSSSMVLDFYKEAHNEKGEISNIENIYKKVFGKLSDLSYLF